MSDNIDSEKCNAHAPICGQRCTLEPGHTFEHQYREDGRLVAGWFGNHTNDFSEPPPSPR